MQFNGESNNLDLYSEARIWAGIDVSDTATYPIAEFTRDANFGMDRCVSIIQHADGTWEWDDYNNSDLPIATTDLVAGQQDYGLAATHRKIRRVRTKDAQGNWITLEPVDRHTLTDAELNEDNGTPRKYDLIGMSVMLYPAPSYDMDGGLELEHDRGASYFATTDTTKQPGFDSQFHRLIALYGALDYCERNALEARAASIRNRLGRAPDPIANDPGAGMEKDLANFYANRDVDQRPQLTPRKEDYGQSALC
ncbi:hypothetical protein [Bradyrhizobium elkanii]|uniref:phage adaptor protein n=1 Tax=Bradyrhizobium elkanii TaxID=29448 RepID=UPI003D1E9CC4